MPAYRPIRERWEAKVLRTDTCWLWTGGLYRTGYGSIGREKNGGNTTAHRVAWELYRGPIPEGLHIDHLCRVRACVNPDHLEPVTPGENTLRSPIAYTAVQARKTACGHGHPFTPENIYWTAKGSRRCRKCGTRWNAERRARRRAEGKIPT